MIDQNTAVYCLKYAESTLPERMVFAGGSRDIKIPISFAIYCICVDDRKILVDAGCETMTGFVMKDFISPVKALQQIGLSAGDVTDVILTHAHHDHIECIKHFGNAVIHIADEALEAARKYIPENRTINLIQDKYSISEGITVLKIGGHAIGSTIVELHAKDTVHILAGDECYTAENIAKKICTGSYVDKEKAVGFIEKYSNEAYCVHTCHDITLKTERIF